LKKVAVFVSVLAVKLEDEMTTFSLELMVTCVLEQAYREPTALDGMLKREDVQRRADLEMARLVILDEYNRQDLRDLERLIRSAPERLDNKSDVAARLLKSAQDVEHEKLKAMRQIWARIVARTPALAEVIENFASA
jgi:hypothetical protein